MRVPPAWGLRARRRGVSLAADVEEQRWDKITRPVEVVGEEPNPICSPVLQVVTGWRLGLLTAFVHKLPVRASRL